MNSIFVVGDSISIQYGPYLETYLKGHLNYARKSGEEKALENLDIAMGANGGDSERVFKYLEAQFGDESFKPDFLVLNCGLHDLKSDPESNTKQIDIEQYEKNLQSIVALASKNNTPIIWVRTTPIDNAIANKPGKSFFRYNEDVIAYNEVADKVMTQHQIKIIDLNTFTLATHEYPWRDHAHFHKEVQKLQGAFIAGHLMEICK